MAPPRPAALLALLAAALVALTSGTAPALAQQPSPSQVPHARPLQLAPALNPPVADTGVFSPLALPEPSLVRGPDGRPGPRYWQQRADYDIRVVLDTAANRLTGRERLRYGNNSPDTLRYVWMQMDQNLFRPGSRGSLLFAEESRFGGAGFNGGFEVERIAQVDCAPPAATPQRRGRRARPPRGTGASAATASSAAPRQTSTDTGGLFGCREPRAPAPLESRVDDTMMRVDLAVPLAPGASTVLEVAYAFTVPEHGADRMGREGSLYEIAQWYPRMAVYDDVHGWNTDPYLGQGEFYLEYGTIDYEVTLPAGFLVAGTGTLRNPGEVLTTAQRARLALAAASDTTIAIVSAADLTSGAARPTRAGTLTWRFHADSVRDAAWAASPQYLWDASSWDGIVAQAYYRLSAAATWREAAKMSRFSIQEYSDRWLRYPYPQISAVEGPVSGMEYPMVAMEARGQSGPDLFNVVTHEIGHMWYPMVVGSDERRYAWMDEGFNTFINTFSEARYWDRDDTATRQGESRFVVQLDQTGTAQPILTPANRYRTSNNLLSLAYVKPSIVLLALRNNVLGADGFDSAFREYTRRWVFRHPQPADFFRTMESASGRDLSWFWRGFFLTTGALDQSVESVVQAPDNSAEIAVRSLGAAVMPVELQITYADATSDTLHLPVEIWYGGDRFVYHLAATKLISVARVNPGGNFPDVNPANDAWQAATSIPTP